MADWRSEYYRRRRGQRDLDRRRDGQLSVTLLTSVELLYSKDGRYFGGCVEWERVDLALN